jgi:feruloyl-CoA synthase
VAAARLFAAPRVTAETAADGSVLLRSADPLGEYPATVIHSLRAWAGAAPDHPLVAERAPDGGWRRCSYGEAAAAADAIGQALLERGLGPDRPLLVLSGNSVDHHLVTLGALTAGVPIAPVSVAYSLQSQDHARIRAIAGLIRPGAVFAEDAARFGAALDAVAEAATAPGTGPQDVAGAAAAPGVIVSTGHRAGAEPLAGLLATPPGAEVRAAFAAADPDAVAKILFTSGSTGVPKGVLNTHRMLSANQQMIRQVWPFLAAERPVIVDWLPWSHTFGGNHNVNMVLTTGGTLYVDAGRPAPALFAQTVANLAEVPPTVYFNVPAGYAQLVPALEADPAFAARFFSRLRLLFNAAAALPGGLRDRLGELAVRVAGREIPVTGSWGATETAPAVTTAHFGYADARCIGAPLPGAEVKLVPVPAAREPAVGDPAAREPAVGEPADGHEGPGDGQTGPAGGRRYEIRARGPMVTPGYFGRPDLTSAAVDEQGFYRSGDAVSLADPGDPDAGLVFRGRLAEDFKLATGTFVRVGALRTALLSAAPILSDAVITGEERPWVGALAWLNLAEARRQLGAEPQPQGELIADEAVRTVLAQALAGHNATAGSAARVGRLLVLARAADLDAGEITDKGYVNQRQVLARRAALVELLYAEPAPAGVIVADPSA